MMSASKLSFVAFFFLLIFLKLNHISCVENNIIVCRAIEKQALLALKQSLEYLPEMLSSWVEEINCCKWKGVVCNNITGHVHQLHLRSYDLSVKLNSSFLNLKHLRFLDLSGNNFVGEIPSFIGSFTHLKYLNLSNAGFHGNIPHTIGNLSNLRILCLRSLYLSADNLEWLTGLQQLEHLNMNRVDLSNVPNWIQVINRLASLEELSLRACNLNFMALDSVINITSLTILDLSYNEFDSIVPKWIFQLNKLTFLDLAYNGFQGLMPSTSNTTILQHIDLYSNDFNSTIPGWLYSCKDLQYINFDENQIYDTISNDIGNLTSLHIISLSGNMLFGNMPDSLGNISNLEDVDLQINQLVGGIPTTLEKLSSLKNLGLSANRLTGHVPESVGQLFNLQVLCIDHNMFEGTVNENHFVNLTKLKRFVASGNHLILKVELNWVPPFQLDTLRLGSWDLGLGTQIPPWLETQRSISELDLSDTGISGTVPNWIWDIKFLNLSYNSLHGHIPDINETIGAYRCIWLNSNRFVGQLARVPSVALLDLSDNLLTGGISHFFCNATTETFENSKIWLGRNMLSGELPDCFMKWPSLGTLDLGDNNLSGRIPRSIGLTDMESLNLYGNKFFGQIPDSLMNCTNLGHIDFGDNGFDGNIPTQWGISLPNLRILMLNSNKLSGEISSNICHLKQLKILDLSNNRFYGIIPKCIDNFTNMAVKEINLGVYDHEKAKAKSILKKFNLELSDAGQGVLSRRIDVAQEGVFINVKGRRLHYDTILPLVTGIDLSNNYLSGEIPNELASLVELRCLNLSGNHLTGLIPHNIGDMKQLESLDLSRNSLHGEMPSSFSVMFSLSYLNLSYNNLTGKIPESTQLQGFDPSSFAGNNLCGSPLTSNCSYQFPKARDEDDNKDNESKVQWLYVFISLGYAVGLSATCTVLVLKKSWRVALFGFVEDSWDAIYVYFYIKRKRLQRRLGRSS